MNSPSDVGGLLHLVQAAALTELPRSVVSDDDDDRPSKKTFPQRLMDILSDSTLSDVVAWLPHGRSFVVIRPDLFCASVLPKATDARSSTKYASFTRKLNRWGFRQATRGHDAGAFHHDLFRRDEPQLCLQMVCQKACRGTTAKKSLPPKKRAVRSPSPQIVSDASKSDDSTMNTPVVPMATLAAAAQPQQQQQCAVLPIASEPTTASVVSKDGLQPLPFVSNDPQFVANVLKQRDEEERLRVAKAALYEAFHSAMNGRR